MNNIKINQLEQRLINSSYHKQKNDKVKKENNISFSKVFSNIKEKEDIKFSKHAKNRLIDRNMSMTSIDIEKLDKAFEKAEMKGVSDALIMVDKNIYIANIESKTIITALEEKDLNERVFTNIDGAVII